ncbi:MAG: hypothetical protein ABIK28_04435 [Planctomycetota bacterium]
MNGHLIGVFFELRKNTLLAKDLEKLRIRAHHGVSGLVQNLALERHRESRATVKGFN